MSYICDICLGVIHDGSDYHMKGEKPVHIKCYELQMQSGQEYVPLPQFELVEEEVRIAPMYPLADAESTEEEPEVKKPSVRTTLKPRKK